MKLMLREQLLRQNTQLTAYLYLFEGVMTHMCVTSLHLKLAGAKWQTDL